MTERSMLLELKQVGYQTATTKILNNISFTLQRGEFKLITGPSGCGKSTLLKMVASLISPDIGVILFEGRDITTLSPEAIASRFLIVLRRQRYLAIRFTIT